MPFLLVLLLVIVGSSCAREENGAAPEGGRASDAAPSVYERRLVFLASDREPPLGALVDFVVSVGGGELSRSARGWVREQNAWRDFLDITWQMAPMRDPWRVVPHGPLRVVVGDDDDIEALIHRGEPALRLVPGADLASSVPHSGGQLRLRRSRLRVEAREYGGILLDAQFVHRLPPDARSSPGASGDELFLTDGRGMHFVIAGNGRVESFAWFRRGQEERIWNDAEVEWQEAETTAGGAAPLAGPASWRVWAREGGFHGELQPIDGHVLEDGSGDVVPAAVAVYAVSGWLDVLGERRQVYGIVRHARE